MARRVIGRLLPSGVSLVVVVMVACLGGLKARERIASHEAAEVAWSAIERDPRAFEEAPRAAGRFVELRASEERVHGRIEGGGPPLAIPTGAIRPGEELALHGRGRDVCRARGFSAGEAESGGAAPLARSVLSVDELVRVAPPRAGPGTLLATLFRRARQGAMARLESIADMDARGLVSALLLGESASISSDLADLFSRTGARHLLALSGMHVALVAWWIVRPSSRALARLVLPPSSARLELACLVEVGTVLALVLLWGAYAPVTRAGVAWVIAALAPLVPARDAGGVRVGRRPDALSLLAAAALLECLLDPLAVNQLSFRLSYAATLGLILGYGRMRRRLLAVACGGTDPLALGSRLHGAPVWLRVPLALGLECAVGSLAASTVALIATAPFAWCSFGECTWAALPATLVSLPPMLALLVCGTCELAFGALHPDLLLEVVTRAWIAMLAWLDRFPATPLALPERPVILIALAGAGWFAWIAGGLRARGAGERATAALSAALFLPWTLDPCAIEIRALDVGHGACVLLRLPGGSDWIYDAGSLDRPGLVREAIAPTLRALEVGDLVIVSSHGHRDHAGALDWIASRYPLRAWIGAAPARTSVRRAHAGGFLDLQAGGVELRRLPDDSRGSIEILRGLAEAGNEGSRALLVRLGGARALLLGDAEEDGLRAMLDAGGLDGPLALLLAPHHGSATPWLHELLERTRPREVWISASRPPAIAAELDRRGIPWRWTGRDGPLALELGRGRESEPDGDWHAECN